MHYSLLHGHYFLQYGHNSILVVHYFLSHGCNSCETSTIFCDMPIFLSLIFIVHSAMLSIHCLIGIISSPIAIIPSVIVIDSYDLNLLPLVRNSASTEYHLKVILSPLQFTVS